MNERLLIALGITLGLIFLVSALSASNFGNVNIKGVLNMSAQNIINVSKLATYRNI